jgi:putative redox protein
MTTSSIKRVNIVHAVWRGPGQFDSGRAGAPAALIDSAAKAAQSPPDLLLSALATCSGLDVVDILAKRKTPVESLEVDVVGERREEHPRRFVAIDTTFDVRGPGIERVHAERAVALSFEKYCTVAASLASDIVVHATVLLNGELGERVRQTLGH